MLVGMWQRSGSSFRKSHGANVASVRGLNAEGQGVQGWKGRGEGAGSFINFERDSGVSLRAATNKPQYKPIKIKLHLLNGAYHKNNKCHRLMPWSLIPYFN